VHGVLFVLIALAGLMLSPPAAVERTNPRGTLAGMFQVMTEPGPLRVAAVFAMLVLMGLGTNTVFPAWYALQHGVSLGAASGVIGVANLTMVAGGVLTAVLLARGFTHRAIFAALALAGVLAAASMFWPAVAVAPRVTALVAWFVVSGACIAATTAMLPRVVQSPRQGAAAAGLLSQLAAATSFVTPLIWAPLLAGGHWTGFLAVIGVATLVGVALFPGARHEAR
jgi:hypothetical protein